MYSEIIAVYVIICISAQAKPIDYIYIYNNNIYIQLS